MTLCGESVGLDELLALNEGVLEAVYPNVVKEKAADVPSFAYTDGHVSSPALKIARPKALIPVFPGTNCEYDTARAWMEAGGEAEILVIRNLTAADVAESVERFARAMKTAQTIFHL